MAAKANNHETIKQLKKLIEAQDKILNLKANCFEQQWSFITDSAKLKCVITPRRSGKSYALAFALIKQCLELPRCKCLFSALTKENAKNIMWDIYHILDQQLDLGLNFNETTQRILFPNGSTIITLGLNSNPNEKNKIRGSKLKLACIDEAGFFGQDLNKIVEDVILPATADTLGTVIIAGTPGENITTLFYDVTEKKKKGWSVHRWGMKENTFNVKETEQFVADFKSRDPDYENNPTYKREVLGEWHTNPDYKVYYFDYGKNTYDGDIPIHDDANNLPISYLYTLGIDLGWAPDPSAFTLLAHSPYYPTIYCILSFKSNMMTFTELGETVQVLREKYKITNVVVDNTSKQGTEDLRYRSKIPFQYVEKAPHYKKDAIGIVNTELRNGRIKLNNQHCQALIEEMDKLIWDEGAMLAGIKKEHPRMPNHCTDSFLYAFRFLRKYTTVPIKETYKQDIDKYVTHQIEQRAMNAKKQKNELSSEFWEKLF